MEKSISSLQLVTYRPEVIHNFLLRIRPDKCIYNQVVCKYLYKCDPHMALIYKLDQPSKESNFAGIAIYIDKELLSQWYFIFTKVQLFYPLRTLCKEMVKRVCKVVIRIQLLFAKVKGTCFSASKNPI